jgi:DNA-binding NtrC family response regulator
LLVEDKRGMRSMLTTALTEDGWEVTAVADGSSALGILGSRRFDLILTDVCLPGSVDGLAVLAAARKSSPAAPVILMTAFGTIDLAVSAMKGGARDFVTKPFDLDRLLSILREASPAGPQALVGESGIFRQAVERGLAGASTGMSILILGESGTGKELLARAVHDASQRKGGPFIPVNCAAIPPDLLESELFGAEKGAYTGSESRRPGRFELADGGTVFLDEVGDLALQLQGKLLRVLQEREFTRVGGQETVRVDVRIVAASNRDLEAEAGSGRFRADLYYRLCEFPVRLPPLRERMEDVPLLAAHFLREAGLGPDALDGDACTALCSYTWPGNVRELRSIILRAAALARSGRIDAGELEIPTAPGEGSGLLDAAGSASREAQKRMISAALEKSQGNKTRAARMLKISYRTLLNRLKELGMG